MASERRERRPGCANEQRQEAAKVTQTVEQEWQSALTAARTEYTDFDEVIKKQHFEDEEKTKPLPIVNNAMMHVAQNSEAGAKILYWLGTHPKEANEIAVKTFIKNVSDTRAVERSIRAIHKEFDKIEAELAANPPKPLAKPVTQATAAAEVDDLEDDEINTDTTEVSWFGRASDEAWTIANAEDKIPTDEDSIVTHLIACGHPVVTDQAIAEERGGHGARRLKPQNEASTKPMEGPARLKALLPTFTPPRRAAARITDQRSHCHNANHPWNP